MCRDAGSPALARQLQGTLNGYQQVRLMSESTYGQSARQLHICEGDMALHLTLFVCTDCGWSLLTGSVYRRPKAVAHLCLPIGTMFWLLCIPTLQGLANHVVEPMSQP